MKNLYVLFSHYLTTCNNTTITQLKTHSFHILIPCYHSRLDFLTKTHITYNNMHTQAYTCKLTGNYIVTCRQDIIQLLKLICTKSKFTYLKGFCYALACM